MIKYICLIAFAVLQTIMVSAQNQSHAEKLVNEFITAIDKDAIQTDFLMAISEEDGTPIEELKGSLLVKKNKFSFQAGDINVFFDGKTQWTYVSTNNEVTITEPSEDELAEINPFLILNEYYDKSNFRLSDYKSDENYIVIMTPDIAGSDFDEIEIQFNKKTKNPVSVDLSATNGYDIHIIFSNFSKGMNITGKSFVFDKSRYKGVFENDLR